MTDSRVAWPPISGAFFHRTERRIAGSRECVHSRRYAIPCCPRRMVQWDILTGHGVIYIRQWQPHKALSVLAKMADTRERHVSKG
jgi:hypothetical protein